MTTLSDIIIAVSDLIDAQFGQMANRAEKIIAVALVMAAVFVFSVGGLVLLGVAVFYFLHPVFDTAGTTLVLGLAAMFVAVVLVILLNQRKV